LDLRTNEGSMRLFIAIVLLMFLFGCEAPVNLKAQAEEQEELFYGTIDSRVTPIMVFISLMCMQHGEVDRECLKETSQDIKQTPGQLSYDFIIESANNLRGEQ